MFRQTLPLFALVAFASLFGLVLATDTAPGVETKPTKEITNSIGMKLVRIPAATFKMGSPKGEKDRRTDEQQHDVEITKAFWLGMHEVTQKQFKAVMGYNPSFFSTDGKGKTGVVYRGNQPAGGKDDVSGKDTNDFPVENVSWDEANEFCEKATALAAEKKSGRKYRLPTEAEWEHACRAGTSSYQVFHFGDSLSSKQANCDGDSPYGGASKGPFLQRTCKIGSYKPNAFGLFDMHGNVAEWCADWYQKDYQKDKKKDPKGPDESIAHMIRGGSWYNRAQDCRSACRDTGGPSNNKRGFRVALDLSGK